MLIVDKTYILPGSYAFCKDESLLDVEDLKAFFEKSSDTFEAFQSACCSLNGSWAVVVYKDGEILSATDHRATRPLFFRQCKEKIYFSENAFDLIFEGEKFNISEDVEKFFALNGFILKDQTLHNDIKRLQAGCALHFDGKHTKVEFYDKNILDIRQHPALSYQEVKTKFKEVLEKVFFRAKKLIGDRPIVLPLTAGRDSRLIASLLKKIGFENVHCITYGIGEDCFEYQKAKIIASKLGYNHTFVSSIPKDCGYLGYTQNNDIIDYLKYICSLSSSYYFAEYEPAKWILNNYPAGSLPIVLPGHNGDEIRGESLIHPFFLDKNPKKMIDYLTMREGGNRVIGKEEFKTIRSMIEAEINKYPKHFDTICKYEHYINYEVMPKFYTNSSKSWRYFGISVFLPFLDKELCETVYSIPIKYRWGRKIYEEISNEYYSEYGITFSDDVNSEQLMNSLIFKVKEFLRPRLAQVLNKRSKLWFGDTIGLKNIMGGKLFDEVKEKSPYKPTNENGLASAWILLKIKEKYGI